MADNKFNKDYMNLLSAVNSALSELSESKKRVEKDSEGISKAYSAEAKNSRDAFGKSVSALTARLGADNAVLKGIDMTQKGKKRASDTSLLAYSRYSSDLNNTLGKGQIGKTRAERRALKSSYDSDYRIARNKEIASAKIRRLEKAAALKKAALKKKKSSKSNPSVTPSFEDLMVYAQKRHKAGEPLVETINYMSKYLGGNMFKAIDLYAQGTGTDHLKVDREFWNASPRITPEELNLLRLKYMGVPLNNENVK